MAVKEKTLSDTPASEAEVAEAEVIEWSTVENELHLLQSLCGTRPIGNIYYCLCCQSRRHLCNPLFLFW